MNAYRRTLTFVASPQPEAGCRLSLTNESAFGTYIPVSAPDHPAYRFCAVVALLCPPLGFLAYILLNRSQNRLDRALGKALLWRSITLPVTISLFFSLVSFLLRLSPQGRLWIWW